jgi:ATP-binding cassette, subfamily F, member 2
LQYVIESAQKEVARLEALAEALLEETGGDSEALQDVYDRQTELDPSTFESRASQILVGLGFNSTTLHKKTKDMSGGWRMRVALARALFISPSMLLLDEPTNHLDLEACVWLEDYLSRYSKILVVVSHSQDFLNGVCTCMMVMQNRKLRYWTGNYDTMIKTRSEQDKNQIKQYEKQQEEIAHIKAFIASCGTYANLVRQAKSREKQLNKMIDDGLIEMPYTDPIFRFSFTDSGKLPPPLISFSEVAFSYSGKKDEYLFSNLSFGVDSDSRIALVGPNGAGKSTLLKLMVRENSPCEGTCNVRSGVVIGRYHQHSAEVLDNDKSPVEYISSKFHDMYPEKKLEDWRCM